MGPSNFIRQARFYPVDRGGPAAPGSYGNDGTMVIDNVPTEPEPEDSYDPWYGDDDDWSDPYARRLEMANTLLANARNMNPIHGGGLEFGARLFQGALGALMQHRLRKEEDAYQAEQDRLYEAEQRREEARRFLQQDPNSLNSWDNSWGWF